MVMMKYRSVLISGGNLGTISPSEWWALKVGFLKPK